MEEVQNLRSEHLLQIPSKEASPTPSVPQSPSLYFSLFMSVCVCVYMCTMCICEHTYHDIHMEIRGKLYGVNSLLAPHLVPGIEFRSPAMHKQNLYSLSHLDSPRHLFTCKNKDVLSFPAF